jgi:hypothetical protein
MVISFNLALREIYLLFNFSTYVVNCLIFASLNVFLFLVSTIFY